MTFCLTRALSSCSRFSAVIPLSRQMRRSCLRTLPRPVPPPPVAHLLYSTRRRDQGSRQRFLLSPCCRNLRSVSRRCPAITPPSLLRLQSLCCRPHSPGGL